eukprot:jgi/Botrbrau1/7384/Bobra.0316s0027.1
MGLDSNTNGADTIIAASSRLKDQKIYHQMHAATAALHKGIRDLDKLISAAFPGDIHREISPPFEFDRAVLNQVIAQHFYQTGRLSVASTFVEEAHVVGADALQEAFKEMHDVLREIRSQNLNPAMQWVHKNHKELIRVGGQESTDGFLFQLHEACYLQEFKTKGFKAALAYGKTHFIRFSPKELSQIQRLMGLLVFAKRPNSSMYLDLRKGPNWEAISASFMRQACGLMGLAPDSPLLVAVGAGAETLPVYLKHEGLPMTNLGQAQVNVSNEFIFHSIFICPVSREQSTPADPPMLLPCGHVLARQSIHGIIKGHPQRPFKCPSCPKEAKESECREIRFPKRQRK